MGFTENKSPKWRLETDGSTKSRLSTQLRRRHHVAGSHIRFASLRTLLSFALGEEHLPYELDMLDEAAAYAGSTEAAATHTTKGPAWFKRSAAIEAFWTHARNLIEFLRREKSPDLTVNSASAKDFTDGFHSDLEMQSLENKINAQICHLGYSRTTVDYEKLGHEISYVKPALDSHIKRFEEKLDVESRKHWAQRTPLAPRGPEPPTYTARAATTASVSVSFMPTLPDGPMPTVPDGPRDR